MSTSHSKAPGGVEAEGVQQRYCARLGISKFGRVMQ